MVDGSFTLTLTSDAPSSVTFQDYKDAIAAITFDNNNGDLDTTDRTLTFVVNDGESDSNTESLAIKVHAVDDAPIVATTPLDPTFTEEGSAVSVFTGTAIDAVESGNTIGAFEISIAGVADGVVDRADLHYYLEEFLGTKFGDVNLSGRVDPLSDYIAINQSVLSGEGSGWSGGALDFNGVVDQTDIDIFINSLSN